MKNYIFTFVDKNLELEEILQITDSNFSIFQRPREANFPFSL